MKTAREVIEDFFVLQGKAPGRAEALTGFLLEDLKEAGYEVVPVAPVELATYTFSNVGLGPGRITIACIGGEVCRWDKDAKQWVPLTTAAQQGKS